MRLFIDFRVGISCDVFEIPAVREAMGAGMAEPTFSRGIMHHAVQMIGYEKDVDRSE